MKHINSNLRKHNIENPWSGLLFYKTKTVTTNNNNYKQQIMGLGTNMDGFNAQLL